uniref:DUF7730 domain-containing protein n=1 Tax=Mycena chlorophos TaxID=658473 RepID=A0ABQ0KXS4_MYCCL|nr:predicted protein [Mycena chlorophos]
MQSFLSDALGIVECVCCLPVLLVFTVLPGRFQRSRSLPDPDPLPTHRKDPCRRAAKAQPDSPFMGLPRELRDIIYSEALGGRQVALQVCTDWARKRRIVRGTCFRGKDSDTIDVRDDQPNAALLRICRQVYAEAHAIPLRENVFFLGTYYFEQTLLASVGPHALGELRSVVLRYNTFPSNDWIFEDHEPSVRYHRLEILLQMTGLRKLVVRFTSRVQSCNPDTIRMNMQYDPRSVVDTAWGRRVCKMASLRGVRFEFTLGGVETDLGDSRWRDLEREILKRISCPPND